MKVAELFVALGIKGGDKTKKDLGDTNTALKGAYDSSLALKAAIVGVAIGLERMTGWASQVGMDLHKFGVSTGLSTQQLQNWQYMAMKFDVGGQEMTETIKNLQAQMSQMELTGAQPTGMMFVAEELKKAGKEINIQRGFKDTFYMMDKLKQFAQLKSVPIGISNEMLKSFGLSSDMIQMLRLVNTERDKISKQDVLTQGEEDRLTDMNIKWKEFWFTLRTIGLKFVANDMGSVIDMLGNAGKLIRTIVDEIVRATNEVSEVKPILAAIALAITAYFAPVTATILALIAVFDDIQKFREGKDSVTGSMADYYKNKAKDIHDFFNPSEKRAAFEEQEKRRRETGSAFPGWTGTGGFAVPPTPTVGPATGANQQSIEQNNTFYIQGQDPKETASEVQRGQDRAVRQSFAQLQGA